MSRWLQAIRDHLALSALALRLGGGRWFWVLPILPLAWPLFQISRLALSSSARSFQLEDAQGLIELPLIVLAIGLGVRVIAGEADRRTIEIAYTVPGGARRIWLAKLSAAAFVLLVAESLVAITVFLFLTQIPFGALYGAYQAALFFLILGAGFGALTKSEITGSLATGAVTLVTSLFSGEDQFRFSPLWNPLMLEGKVDSVDLAAQTLQNRLFIPLVILGLLALAFSRAERREKMMAG